MGYEARTAVILGAQSAIAEAFAKRLAERRMKIVLVGRNAARLDTIREGLLVQGAPDIFVDVRDLIDDAKNAGERIAAWTKLLDGSIDVLAICHGYLGNQESAEHSVAEASRILQTNFTSAMLWAGAAAEQMERQGRGRLIIIGSVAGDRGRRGNYIYGAAKAGLACLVQGLNHRFAASDIRAVLIKPGLVDTPMTDGYDKSSPLWTTPETVAAGMVKALSGHREIVYSPSFWFLIMLVIKNLPRWIFNRLNI